MDEQELNRKINLQKYVIGIGETIKQGKMLYTPAMGYLLPSGALKIYTIADSVRYGYRTKPCILPEFVHVQTVCGMQLYKKK